jgi:hypothetical protein
VRVQLRRAAPAAALLVVTGARAADAQEPDDAAAEASLRVYADDDRVTVVTPSAWTRLRATPRVSLELDATIDVVSAASVDVTSQASPHAFEELRIEGGVAATVRTGRATSIVASLIGSGESDYRSLHLGLGVRAELARRNTVVDLRYDAALDQVGRRGDPAFARARHAHRVVAAVTQVLDAKGYLDVVVDGEWVTGYQASPYRYVPMFAPDGARLYDLPEATPDRRTGVAVLARVRRAVGPLFLHVDYRLYRDDWDLWSHTGTVRAVLAASERVTVSAHARGYTQSAASFHRERYVADAGTAPAWRTRDRALGGMVSVTGGVSLDLAPAGEDSLHVIAAVGVTRFVWLDYALQRERDAIVATLGVNTPF